MKNLLKLILLSVITIAFSSCSKSEEQSAVEPSLVGEWEYSKSGYINSQNQEILSPYENSCTNKKDFIKFSETNTYTDKHYRTDCVEMLENSTYTRNNEFVHFYDQGVEANYRFKILSLTNNELKVKYIYNSVSKSGNDLYVFIRK